MSTETELENPLSTLDKVFEHLYYIQITFLRNHCEKIITVKVLPNGNKKTGEKTTHLHYSATEKEICDEIWKLTHEITNPGFIFKVV